jgi:hypothetical protein
MSRLFFALFVVEEPDDPTLPPRRFAAMGVTSSDPNARVASGERSDVDFPDPPVPCRGRGQEPNAALAAYVQQTIVSLDTAEAGLGADPTLAPKDKRRASKFRKGGQKAFVQIGNLATQNQLESPALQVAVMLGLLGRAGALQALADRLAAFVKHVGDVIFSSQSTAWEMATNPRKISEEAGATAMFADMDMPASSAITRKKLGWTPVGPGLIADLDRLET